MWETRSVFHISMPRFLQQDGLRRWWSVTEARNTHKTGLREITYLWHPWHGQRVLVRGEARRGGGTVLRCVRDERKGFPILEIPEWMFDSNLCGRMKPAETLRVDCAALLALKYLLSAATECSHQDMVEAQHDSSSSGDADAQAVSAQEPSRRVVFSSSEAPPVARRSAAEDGPTLSQDVERTLAPQLRCPVCTGPMLIIHRMTSSELYFRSGVTLPDPVRCGIDSPELSIAQPAWIIVPRRRAQAHHAFVRSSGELASHVRHVCRSPRLQGSYLHQRFHAAFLLQSRPVTCTADSKSHSTHRVRRKR